MLLELPTADEIDELVCDIPDIIVRRFEFDLLDRKIDLDYTPCKGETVVVVKGKAGGVYLVRKGAAAIWSVPSGRIEMNESPETAGHRVAKERCGLELERTKLKALYDVTRHYENISVKRLFVVYECEATKGEQRPPETPETKCVLHKADLDKLVLEDIDSQAIADCL